MPFITWLASSLSQTKASVYSYVKACLARSIQQRKYQKATADTTLFPHENVYYFLKFQIRTLVFDSLEHRNTVVVLKECRSKVTRSMTWSKTEHSVFSYINVLGHVVTKLDSWVSFGSILMKITRTLASVPARMISINCLTLYRYRFK